MKLVYLEGGPLPGERYLVATPISLTDSGKPPQCFASASWPFAEGYYILEEDLAGRRADPDLSVIVDLQAAKAYGTNPDWGHPATISLGLDAVALLKEYFAAVRPASPPASAPLTQGNIDVITSLYAPDERVVLLQSTADPAHMALQLVSANPAGATPLDRTDVLRLLLDAPSVRNNPEASADIRYELSLAAATAWAASVCALAPDVPCGYGFAMRVLNYVPAERNPHATEHYPPFVPDERPYGLFLVTPRGEAYYRPIVTKRHTAMDPVAVLEYFARVVNHDEVAAYLAGRAFVARHNQRS